MKHIILLGDSIFDNKSYVSGGKDTITNLRDLMPDDWTATLLAIDGSVADSLSSQLPNVPYDATHLFISVGGNDALGEMGILQMRVSSAAEVFNEISNVVARFEDRYKRMLDAFRELEKPFAVCTIYYPRYPDERMQKVAVAALASFNDVIIRQAFRAGVPIIDLRYVCDEDADYANPIEPSVAGGAKIARTIITVVNEHDFTSKQSRVFLGEQNIVSRIETRNYAEPSSDDMDIIDRIDKTLDIDDDEERRKAWEDWGKEDEERNKNQSKMEKDLSDLTDEEIDNLKEGDLILWAGTLEDAKATLKEMRKNR